MVHLAVMVVVGSVVEVSEGDSVVADLHRRVVAEISLIRNCMPTIMARINRVLLEEVVDMVVAAAAAAATTVLPILKVNQVNKSWFAT